MELTQAVAAVKALQRRLKTWDYASGLLSHDGATVAPSSSAVPRGDALAQLAEARLREFTAHETGKLLEFLQTHADELDEQTRREVEMLVEQYDRQTRIPPAEWAAFQRLLALSESVWEEAKHQNDYAKWEPYLARVLDAQRKMAGYTQPNKHPYDAMLDDYEKGQTRETLDRFFSMLVPRLSPLVRMVADSPKQIDDRFLRRHYPIDRQRQLTAILTKTMGLSPTVCAVGESEHPFTADLCRQDTRITTHYHENDLASSLYSVIHEAGHARYALGIDASLDGSVLADGASMGIHESQSRFFENIVGRSKPFIHFLFPALQKLFPEQLADVNEHGFWLAVNKVTPSLIRTEADPVTYSLHVAIRYELEKQLIDGTLSTRELPEAWNALYKQTLGVTVPDDTHGVLQDSHWAGGAFGYFPTYALGSAYGAQMLASMPVDWSAVAAGDLSAITDWLSARVWQHGALYPPSDLLNRVCGAPFSPQYYIDYLTQICIDVYDL
ncbi:MAG: carboxypeptidase M32 [Clostridia bacterium]|nr:carboxypeptidase M32 [Clostridia bacterium]